MTAQTFSAPLETLRKRVQEATQRLLGDTIGISDADWNGPDAHALIDALVEKP